MHVHLFSASAAFCLGNHIFFPRRCYRPDFSIAEPDVPASSSPGDKHDLAWLIHECCHVWQFQAKVRNYHWYKALLEHIAFGRAVYDYDIHQMDCLADYRFEQQGQIVQDYAWSFLENGGHPGGTRAERYRTVMRRSLPLANVTATRRFHKRAPSLWRRVLARWSAQASVSQRTHARD